MHDSFRTWLINNGKGDLWYDLSTYSRENSFVTQQNNEDEGILDYIMISPGDFTVLDATILKSFDTISDHRAVFVTLELTKNRKKGNKLLPVIDYNELHEIIKYIKTVPMHWFRYFPWLSNKRQKTLEFLESLKNFLP